MSEHTETPTPAQQHSQQETGKERVGDMLHKERVTRRITLETMAKDLKLNQKYIKSIESNNFDELPATPYVRVYLRSIASYLMLNPEEILKRFNDENTNKVDPLFQSGKAEKIPISMVKETKEKSYSWQIIVGVVLLLTIISLFANKLGWITSPEGNNKGSGFQAASQSASTSTEEHTVSGTIQSPDSASKMGISRVDSLGTSSVSGAGAVQVANNPFANDTLKLTIKATGDSVWVHVFCDGVSWRNYIKSEYSRVFYAWDSINVNLSDVSHTRLFLNGERLNFTGSGVKIFRIDHKGISSWAPAQWKATFKSNP